MHCNKNFLLIVRLIAGLGISIFEYRYTEILKLFSVIFQNIDILKFKPSQFQYYIDILTFKASQFRFWQRFTQSLAKRSHAHTRTNKLMYSYTKRVCIASHSAQRVANRFRNNMSMTLFQAFPPSLRYITVNAVHRWQAQSLAYYCEIYSQHAVRCELQCILVQCIVYCTDVRVLYISLFVCEWKRLPNVS